MTAIAAAYVDGVFVIGADGREVDSSDNTIVSDDKQKIFEFQSAEFTLGYAWTGSSKGFASDGSPLHDLSVSVPEIVKAASVLGSGNWADFVAQFCNGLRLRLPVGVVGGFEKFAVLSFVGFFKGIPSKATVTISYPSSWPEITFDVKIQSPCTPFKEIYAGAEHVWELYKHEKLTTPEAAIRFVRNYVGGCIECREAECQRIGGHLQIAAIRPKEFSWVIPPVAVPQE